MSAARKVAKIRFMLESLTTCDTFRTSPSSTISALPAARWRSISLFHFRIVSNTPETCSARSLASETSPSNGTR
ncbi:MAG TPA: hypothetical protein VHJ18_21585 [Streptosporangiaceae bacterium]|nr:hypothetical protein [Streptosporangiaceae bacterium]